jgi:transposase
VNIGEYARGGKTRGDNQALDHDMDCTEKYIPFGIVDEDSGQLFITFGSSYKTSDFIVDSIKAYWDSISGEEKNKTKKLQFKIDNGPESSGVRRQFLQRMITLADEIKKPIQLLYYPPYHSKYNPIERCWGILEQHWNGSKLLDLKTMLMWASTMTWKGLHPQVTLNNKVYEKGLTLTDLEMELVNNRLERNPSLLKWDILIKPLETVN